MAWDPQQYLAFAGPRMQPAIDLLARVHHENPKVVVDLGCGAGNITPMLVERFPDAKVIGVDSSAEMLERAGDNCPQAEFRQEDIHTWQPEQKPDVLFSNAALQWLENHDIVFPKVVDLVAPGGVLAVQMPRNFEAPSHALMLDVINDGPWKEKLLPVWVAVPTQRPDFYFDLLKPITKNLDIWETEYLQVLEGENPVAEYTKGTWLSRFLGPLEEPWRSEFEAEYRRRIEAAYPRRSDGITLFPFRRTFLLATV